MTLTDYLINGALVLLVVRQLRGRRLTRRQILLPLALVGWAAITYLHGIPTAGNDLVLAVTGALAGAMLGSLAGICTTISRDTDGVPLVKATAAAAALWVIGIGARIGFAQYTEHGGGPAVMRFSAAHHITTVDAWIAALILMSLCEVVARTLILVWRVYGSPVQILQRTSLIAAR